MVIKVREEMPEPFPSPDLQQMQDLVGFWRTLNFTDSWWPLEAALPSSHFTQLLRKDELKLQADLHTLA